MQEDLQIACEALRKKYGSHGAVSRVLGINRDHYCALRNGRASIPKRTAELIVLKAREVEKQEVPPTSHTSPNPEARV